MKEYSLGLDIGTDSIGWALVDENNEVVKKMVLDYGEYDYLKNLSRL